ncbi:uncharacterized protein LOC135139198 [Zophobas morio]|uniref:uncharacterized protein LOC135139198 n=1 Tax=Zophobas morio TaxID=2755281 RepID=UPI0030830CFE
MTTPDAFTTEFHSLQGVTVAEKRKSFFHLLQRNSSLHQNEALLDLITQQLVAETHLEKLFYVDFLIYFRRFRKLSNEFLSGNDIVVNKISKQTWFFERIFQEKNTDFVNQFLPKLGYNLRIKILRKLSFILNEEQSDQLLDALLKRYGFFVASNVLTSCSCDKIEQMLRNHPIKLWTNQLKLLYNKKPDLIYVYLDEQVKHEGNSEFLNSNPIIQFIARKNPEMCCKLLEKYKIQHSRIGKRSTKKIVQYNRDSIIAKPEFYAKNLNSPRFVRKLGKDFEQVYFKLFPRDTNSVFSHWNDASRLLTFYTKKRQFPLFEKTFNEIFYDNLESACASINNNNNNHHYMLAMISDPDEREKWAKFIGEHNKNEQHLKYLKAVNCIDVIKPKINLLSPATKRAQYVKTITECCLLNQDCGTLLTVCELMCGYLKNDTEEVHTKFLEKLTNPKYNYIFDHLSETHWQYIKQIITKAENFNSVPLVFKYFEFTCHQEVQNEGELVSFFKTTKCVNCLFDFERRFKMGKRLLMFLIESAPEILYDDVTIEKIDILLILECKKYNLNHSDDKISVFSYERLIQSVKNVLSGEAEAESDNNFAAAVEWLICSGQGSEEFENLVKRYWDNLENFATIGLTVWFLKHKPNLVMAKINTFLDVTIFGKFSYPNLFIFEKLCDPNFSYKQTQQIWKSAKCYSHLHMDKAIIDFCMSKLRDDNFEEKISLIEPLSLVMPAKNFVKLVESYKPSKPTVDMLNNEENKAFQFQKNLLKSFVQVNEPTDIVTVLFQFLNGDYVASCVNPLHSCLYKIPEDRVKAILDKLCNTGAVSVKKHGFYFVCVTQNETIILQTLKSCSLSQSVAMSYQHFVKNPSQSSWDVLKHKLPKLDNNDHFTSLLLVNKPAPKNYRSRYFEYAFEVFRQKRNRFTTVLVDKLQKEFAGQLTTNFFTSLKNDLFDIKKSDFVLSCYLLYCPDTLKFDVIFDILRTFKQKRWSLRSSEAREKLKNFVTTLHKLYMDCDKTDLTLVTTFTEGFIKIFSPVEAFEEFVLLKIMQFKNQKGANLVNSVVALNNDLVNTYGKLVCKIFADCVNQTLPKFCSDSVSTYDFYCSLLNSKKSVEDVLLVINLLPQARPEVKESALLYYKTLESLKDNKDETVQLHLQLYLE